MIEMVQFTMSYDDIYDSIDRWKISNVDKDEIDHRRDFILSHEGRLSFDFFRSTLRDEVLFLNGRGTDIRLNYNGNPDLVLDGKSALYLGTVGDRLSRFASEDSLSMSMVIVALGDIQRRFFKLVQDFGEKNNYGVGTLMSPGSADGFSIKESIKIGIALMASDLGMSISKEGYLSPDYSAIGMVPLSSRFTGKGVSFLCHKCRYYKECPLRRGAN